MTAPSQECVFWSGSNFTQGWHHIRRIIWHLRLWDLFGLVWFRLKVKVRVECTYKLHTTAIVITHKEYSSPQDISIAGVKLQSINWMCIPFLVVGVTLYFHTINSYHALYYGCFWFMVYVFFMTRFPILLMSFPVIVQSLLTCCIYIYTIIMSELWLL